MKKLVMCGSGHAHLEFINNIKLKDFKNWDLTLISPEKEYFYSGYLPRYILGEISQDEIKIDIEKLCHSKNIQFINGYYLSHAQQNVTLTNNEKIDFDFLSLNLGGNLNFLPDSREVLHLRPVSDFLKQWDKIVSRWKKSGVENVAVVGGGAGGIEISVAIRVLQVQLGAAQNSVHLYTDGPLLGSQYGSRGSVNLTQDLLKLGVQIQFNQKVSHFTRLNKEFRVAISALPLNSWGFKVNQYLQLDNTVFASGDCIEMVDNKKHKKSGVLAVHQGNFIYKNFINLINNKKMVSYIEPNKTLNILINGKNTARLQWGSISLSGRWVKWLKNYIDNKFMQKFKLKGEVEIKS